MLPHSLYHCSLSSLSFQIMLNLEQRNLYFEIFSQNLLLGIIFNLLGNGGSYVLTNKMLDVLKNILSDLFQAKATILLRDTNTRGSIIWIKLQNFSFAMMLWLSPICYTPNHSVEEHLSPTFLKCESFLIPVIKALRSFKCENMCKAYSALH